MTTFTRKKVKVESDPAGSAEVAAHRPPSAATAMTSTTELQTHTAIREAAGPLLHLHMVRPQLGYHEQS